MDENKFKTAKLIVTAGIEKIKQDNPELDFDGFITKVTNFLNKLLAKTKLPLRLDNEATIQIFVFSLTTLGVMAASAFAKMPEEKREKILKVMRSLAE